MIRPVNDFRIGNLVLDEDGELCKIEQLSSEKMECFQQVSTIKTQSCISDKYPSNIYAIELTEEWFLKAGFEKCFTNDFWYSIKIADKRLLISILGNVEIEKWDRTMINFLSICEYVHQLQNLYFALCGEELVFSTEP